jgi:hypothetical protein
MSETFVSFVIFVVNKDIRLMPEHSQKGPEEHLAKNNGNA